jgi:hypothetical protein
MPVLVAVAAVLGFGLFALVPTITYLYVEKRSRKHWLDAASGRKNAPIFVRVVAWWSLAIGQLALPWLLVPATCGTVLFTLAKLGKSSTSGTLLIGALGIAAIAQAIYALRLFPFAIRLLARDAKLRKRGTGFAISFGIVQLVALGAAGLTFTLLRVPGFLNPIVRMTVYYGAIIPVLVFSGIGLVIAALGAGASKNLE